MLTKKFKSNKFYEVTRYIFKYGNETDELDASTTVWDTFEKAITYIERYSTGLKFAGAAIEEIVVNKEITADDYKHGDYEYVSTQKIYDVTLEGVEDFTKEKICYFEKSEQADETVEQETEIIKTMDNWQKSNSSDFDDFAKVEDVVDEDIIDFFVNGISPITYRSNLIQCGEPYTHETNPKTGRWEPAFITFARELGSWVYKGICFYREYEDVG